MLRGDQGSQKAGGEPSDQETPESLKKQLEDLQGQIGKMAKEQEDTRTSVAEDQSNLGGRGLRPQTWQGRRQWLVPLQRHSAERGALQRRNQGERERRAGPGI